MADDDRSWVLPEEPLPVRLMNTLRAERGTLHDDLGTPADLAAWLASAGFGTVRAGAGDLRDARELRDALRTLAAFVTGDTRPAARPP
ncbi:ABATE domain-containing protein, partial [Cellulomonas cellasea]